MGWDWDCGERMGLRWVEASTEVATAAARFQIQLASRVLNVRLSPLQRDVDFSKCNTLQSRHQRRTFGKVL